MKKILLASTVPVLAATFLGAPYYLGIQAQKSLSEQHQILADTFLFDVVSHEYDRGWFSSSEKTVIRFHPNVLSNIQAHLPDNIRTILDKPIVLQNHVQHGLFANGLRPVRAVVQTEIQYDPAVEKVLSRFFGSAVPSQIQNIIYLNGSGTMTIQVAPFEYEELSGIKLDWKGMTSEIQYEAGFARYQTHFTFPALTAKLADKGEISFKGLSLKTDTYPSPNHIALGSSETTLEQFSVQWNNNLDYNFRLNELVNMVTDLQIGAFINPNGNIPPSKIAIEQLSYTTKTEENQGLINSNGVFRFQTLNYGDDRYGPLHIDAAANHIDSAALYALKQKWERIAMEKHDTSKTQDLLLSAVREEGAGIFTNNPEFKLNRFDFQTPQGHIKAHGELQFNGLVHTDLNNFSEMVKKLKAKLNIDVSEQLLEHLAVSQARSLFSIDDPNNQEETEEINETIRLMFQNSLFALTEDGYITQKNGNINTEIQIENNQLQLNGKNLSLQSEEEMFEQIESEETPAIASTTP